MSGADDTENSVPAKPAAPAPAAVPITAVSSQALQSQAAEVKDEVLRTSLTSASEVSADEASRTSPAGKAHLNYDSEASVAKSLSEYPIRMASQEQQVSTIKEEKNISAKESCPISAPDNSAFLSANEKVPDFDGLMEDTKQNAREHANSVEQYDGNIREPKDMQNGREGPQMRDKKVSNDIKTEGIEDKFMTPKASTSLAQETVAVPAASTNEESLPAHSSVSPSSGHKFAESASPAEGRNDNPNESNVKISTEQNSDLPEAMKTPPKPTKGSPKKSPKRKTTGLDSFYANMDSASRDLKTKKKGTTARNLQLHTFYTQAQDMDVSVISAHDAIHAGRSPEKEFKGGPKRERLRRGSEGSVGSGSGDSKGESVENASVSVTSQPFTREFVPPASQSIPDPTTNSTTETTLHKASQYIEEPTPEKVATMLLQHATHESTSLATSPSQHGTRKTSDKTIPSPRKRPSITEDPRDDSPKARAARYAEGIRSRSGSATGMDPLKLSSPSRRASQDSIEASMTNVAGLAESTSNPERSPTATVNKSLDASRETTDIKSNNEKSEPQSSSLCRESFPLREDKKTEAPTTAEPASNSGVPNVVPSIEAESTTTLPAQPSDESQAVRSKQSEQAILQAFAPAPPMQRTSPSPSGHKDTTSIPQAPPGVKPPSKRASSASPEKRTRRSVHTIEAEVAPIGIRPPPGRPEKVHDAVSGAVPAPPGVRPPSSKPPPRMKTPKKQRQSQAQIRQSSVEVAPTGVPTPPIRVSTQQEGVSDFPGKNERVDDVTTGAADTQTQKANADTPQRSGEGIPRRSSYLDEDVPMDAPVAHVDQADPQSVFQHDEMQHPKPQTFSYSDFAVSRDLTAPGTGTTGSYNETRNPSNDPSDSDHALSQQQTNDEYSHVPYVDYQQVNDETAYEDYTYNYETAEWEYTPRQGIQQGNEGVFEWNHNYAWQEGQGVQEGVAGMYGDGTQYEYNNEYGLYEGTGEQYTDYTYNYETGEYEYTGAEGYYYEGGDPYGYYDEYGQYIYYDAQYNEQYYEAQNSQPPRRLSMSSRRGSKESILSNTRRPSLSRSPSRDVSPKTDSSSRRRSQSGNSISPSRRGSRDVTPTRRGSKEYSPSRRGSRELTPPSIRGRRASSDVKKFDELISASPSRRGSRSYPSLPAARHSDKPLNRSVIAEARGIRVSKSPPKKDANVDLGAPESPMASKVSSLIRRINVLREDIMKNASTDADSDANVSKSLIRSAEGLGTASLLSNDSDMSQSVLMPTALMHGLSPIARGRQAKSLTDRQIDAGLDDDKSPIGIDILDLMSPETEFDGMFSPDLKSLNSKATVVAQKWPWSRLKHQKTGKIFYRNESTGEFQYDQPVEGFVPVLGVEELRTSYKLLKDSKSVSPKSLSPPPLRNKSPIRSKSKSPLKGDLSDTTSLALNLFKAGIERRRQEVTAELRISRAMNVIGSPILEEAGLRPRTSTSPFTEQSGAEADPSEMIDRFVLKKSPRSLPSPQKMSPKMFRRSGGTSPIRVPEKTVSPSIKEYMSRSPKEAFKETLSSDAATPARPSLPCNEVENEVEPGASLATKILHLSQRSDQLRQSIRVMRESGNSESIAKDLESISAFASMQDSPELAGAQSNENPEQPFDASVKIKTLMDSLSLAETLRQQRVQSGNDKSAGAKARMKSVFNHGGILHLKYALPKECSEEDAEIAYENALRDADIPYRTLTATSRKTAMISDLQAENDGTTSQRLKVEGGKALLSRLRELSAWGSSQYGDVYNLANRIQTPAKSTFGSMTPREKPSMSTLEKEAASLKPIPVDKLHTVKGQIELRRHEEILARLKEQDELNQTIAARKIIDHLSNLVDEDGEQSTRSVGASWLQEEMSRRHLLECAVLQRFQLVPPISIRAAKAYHSSPLLTTCPHLLRENDIQILLNDSGIAEWTQSTSRGWNMYSFDEDTTAPLFIDVHSGIVQTGVPFDLQKHAERKELCEEMWEDYSRHLCDKHPTTLVQEHVVLTDPQHGTLYYHPNTDTYTSHIQPAYRKGKSSSRKTFQHKLSAGNYSRTVRGDLVFTEQNAWSQVFKGSEKTGKQRGSLQSKRVACASQSENRGSEQTSSYDAEPMRSSSDKGITWAAEPRLASATAKTRPKSATLHQNKSSSAQPAGQNGRNFKVQSFLFEDKVASGTDASDMDLDVFAGNAVNIRKKKGSRKKGAEIKEFENLLVGIDKMEKEVKLGEVYQANSEPFEFEKSFSEKTYHIYKSHLMGVLHNPTNPVPVLHLSIFLICHACAVQALVCLQRSVELLSGRECTAIDVAKCKLLMMKMAARYTGKYQEKGTILRIIEELSECPDILSQAALCMRQLGADRPAEKLFMGALMVDALHGDALRGYAHMMAECGELTAAHKYLLRVQRSAACYGITRTELGWVEEMKGGKGEAIQAAYRSAIGLQRKDKATSKAYHSLGHYLHIRGDWTQAREMYHKALKADHQNAEACIMLGCLSEPSLKPSADATEIQKLDPNPNPNPAMQDAMFRKGISYMRAGKSLWIAYVAAADHVISVSGDIERGIQLLWAAVKSAASEKVWPVIALAHVYQYTLGRPEQALGLLTWCLRRRKVELNKSINGNLHDPSGFADEDLDDDDDDADDTRAMNLKESDSESGQMAALLTATAYCYFDMRRDSDSLLMVSEALQLDSAYSPALRLLGLVHMRVKTSNDPRNTKSIRESLQHAPSNPYAQRALSILLSLDGKHMQAISAMKAALEIDPRHALSWRALGIMRYLYGNRKDQSIECFKKAIEHAKCEDVDSLRALGQIYLENKKYKSAIECFARILAVHPRDSLTIGSLALIITVKGSDAMAEVIENRSLPTSLRENLRLRNVEAVFEYAIQVGMDSMMRNQNRYNERNRNSFGDKFATEYVQGTRSGENAAHLNPERLGLLSELDPADAEILLEKDVHPQLLYWFGTYISKQITAKTCPTNAGNSAKRSTLAASDLRVNTIDAAMDVENESKRESLVQKSMSLFDRAIQRTDTSPHVLSKYMLGWLAECSGDLISAERRYMEAIQAAHDDPLEYLSVCELAESLCKVAKQARSRVKDKPQKKSGAKKTKKVAKQEKQNVAEAEQRKIGWIYDDLEGLIYVEPTTDNPRDTKTQMKTTAMGNDSDDAKNNHHTATDEEAHVKQDSAEVQHKRNRLLMHGRILRSLHTKRRSISDSVYVAAPSPCVVFDAYWRERLLHAFSECEDWAWMLKCSAGFRGKGKIST